MKKGSDNSNDFLFSLEEQQPFNIRDAALSKNQK